MEKRQTPGARLLAAAAHIYLGMLVIWFAGRQLAGDRWWVFLLNAAGLALFVPLPFILPAAWFTKRRELWVGLGVGLLICVATYGGLLWPGRAGVQAGDPTLTVMTANLLGTQTHPEAAIAALRAANADIVGLQELNPDVAAAIERDLAALYPYRWLDPQPGVTGLGILSRYPISATGETIPGRWLGAPQVVEAAFQDERITVINIHAIPMSLGTPGSLNRLLAYRNEQLESLATFIAGIPGPLVLVGDFNMLETSQGYRSVDAVLDDAWLAAGKGPGATFPSGGAGRTWWFRIDYVWHSPHWRVAGAHLGPWDGYSDHRPAIATLGLQ
ncbi:MAG: endonuclease/exonuclease/phosphatase family protein [Anaerolineae bacterium]|nr:endonuclease/exonuclease/phosphatase family protein [Anaerolineae bacterium]